MSYYLERIYLVQDNTRRLYNICADLIFGQSEKDALQTLNNIFSSPEYHVERSFIYETFCKRAESSDLHRQCVYHKGKCLEGQKIFSRNGSSAGTTVSKSRIRIQCVKCRLSLLFLDTQKLFAEGGQIERTSSRVCGNEVVSEPSLPPGLYLAYSEALLKALSSASDTKEADIPPLLPPINATILFQPQLQFSSFKYTRNPRFGVPKDIQVYGVLTQYEYLQYFYDHSPVQNICHGLPIAPFPQLSCLGVYFFVNDLKFRRIVTDGPNAFAISVHMSPPSMAAASAFVYTCWYCCYPVGDSTHTEWIPYQTAHSVSISCV